jgi:hypothetical protein
MSKVNNPANPWEKTEESRTRIPMSLPQLKLSVPDIPGYHLHWMRGDPARIAQAQKAGYEFVEPDEVNVANTGLADDASATGNTDMGTRVSIVAGGEDGQGQAERLYLMKIKEEWWLADQEVLADRNEQVAASLRGDNVRSMEDSANVYIPDAHKSSVKNMFTRKK